MKYYVGIDIGGTKINIGILNDQTELIASKVTPVPTEKDCNSVLSVAANTLFELCDEFQPRAEKPQISERLKSEQNENPGNIVIPNKIGTREKY